MDFTSDKLQLLVCKWKTLIEAHINVKTVTFVSCWNASLGVKFVQVAVQLRVHVAGVGRCKQPQ
jgi:ribosomal protein S3AE